MFERYTEKARRVIFFARYESSQFGAPCIETEHMLLGLLREDPALTKRVLREGAVESIRKKVEVHAQRLSKISTSVDLPLSQECTRVLAYAAEEADGLRHKHIGPEHLLLGLLREENSFAASILRECGLRLSDLRGQTAQPVKGTTDAQSRLSAYLWAREKQWGISVTTKPKLQVFASKTPVGQVQAPLLCIEVIAPEDRMAFIRECVQGYLAIGVPHVWVIDPKNHAAYHVTPADGWREVMDGVLRTQNPAIEVPLSEVFVAE